jgi:hypothetical protein
MTLKGLDDFNVVTSLRVVHVTVAINEAEDDLLQTVPTLEF